MAKKEIKKVEETAIDQPLSKTEQFLQEKDNQKKIVYGFIALILIVAVIFGWRWMSQRNNEKAQNEIWSSELLFDQGQYEQALEGFEAVIEEFGSTRAGNTAKAYAGLCQKNLGNYEEAIKYLQDFDGNDNVIAPAILSALGDCYVDQETPTTPRLPRLSSRLPRLQATPSTLPSSSARQVSPTRRQATSRMPSRFIRTSRTIGPKLPSPSLSTNTSNELNKKL